MNTEQKKIDFAFMQTALDLAQQSRPSPNPRVGAIIVKNGKIVGQGYHHRQGTPHAEIIALKNAGKHAYGAHLYVTLEPCCHEGRTGPCTSAIHQASLSRIIVGMVDPDQNVRGKGIKLLKSQGHQVEVGIMEDECKKMLDGYIHHRNCGLPLVTLKAAITLDGYCATTTGDSKWISSEASRKIVHQMRAKCDAVVVGIQTVIADDPLLTVRNVQGKTPIRIVMDSSLKISPKCTMIQNASSETPVFVAYTNAFKKDIAILQNINGVNTLKCRPDNNGKVHPKSLIEQLGTMGILSVLVEGGSHIHGSFVKEAVANKLSLFIAPKLLGSGQSWLSFGSISQISNALALSKITTKQIENNILIEGVF